MNEPKLAASDVHPWRGRMLVIAAALLWSTSGFFMKAPFFEGWPGPVLAFWRAAFAGLAMLPLVRRPQWNGAMLPMVGCFAAMSYCYITSMSLMSASSAGNALWLQCTAPVWVLLVGVLFMGERAVWRDWPLVVCSTIGVVLIVALRPVEKSPPEAIALGIVSGITYAGIILSLRHLRAFDSAWLAVLNQFGTALALAPLVWQSGVWPSPTQWLLLAAFGAIQLGLPYFLFALAVKEIPGHEASVIGLLEPLLLPLWIYLAWGDKPDVVTYFGGSWILLGLLLRYWPTRSSRLDKNQTATPSSDIPSQ
jgi:drug/metabolite transporter (DMT)-like permease